MLNRISQRKRRAKKARIIIKKSGRPRVCLHRTLKHFYAQLIVPGEKGDRVLTSISSLDPEIKKLKLVSNNVQRATKLGEIFAKRVLALNVTKVGLDRSGNQYHGRCKAFAEAARTVGLEF
jgi:large subunit ribosomal protein L18